MVVMKHFQVVIVLLLKIHILKGFICPGGQSECASGMTCCKLPNGLEGCCPFQEATCCNDGVHCCPKGLKCLKRGCYHNEEISSVPIKQIGVLNNVICPDKQQCLDGQTCCLVSSSSYGCCPMMNAVCCQDKKHCCPAGTFCNSSGYCYSTEQSLVSYNSTTVCPGGTYICPTRNTCCSVGNKWGCCPFENAVCCSDDVHCCPEGHICSGNGCEISKHKLPFRNLNKINKYD